MSLFGLGKHRAEEEHLRKRVSALQSALDQCKGIAKRWTEVRLEVMGIIAVVFLALGFVLGMYREPILQSAGALAANLGIARPAPEVAAAKAAVQKDDSVTDGQAQLILAFLYYGGRDVAQDYREAAKWFRRAADRGDPAAQFYLGIMYAKGQGVPQDHAEAAKWYRLAADRGNPEAQYNLGLAYATGEGVPQDNVSAHMWFNLAAAGFAAADAGRRSAAVNNRDVVAGKMAPWQVAEAERLAREWKPQ